MVASIKAAVHYLGRAYINRLCVTDAMSNLDHINERPAEYSFALRALAETNCRSVLDVGTGTTAWPAVLHGCGYTVHAIDNVRDYWTNSLTNRHWRVEDVDIRNPNGSLGRYDAITCISVLEHMEDHLPAVQQMVRSLLPGGLLIITTPYSHHNRCANVYRRPDALYGWDQPYICRSSSAEELEQWIGCGLRLVSRELWCMFSGPVWATGQRTAWSRATEDQPHQLGCFAFTASS